MKLLRLQDAGKTAVGWLENRYDLQGLLEYIEKKDVPLHRHSLWYYMGGLALFFFAIQVTTGIFLVLYYRPSPESAHESVKFIMSEVSFGWLIRSIHSWGANVFIGILFLHMISTFFLRAYRKPREMTWVTGALLFFIALFFGFSGYLLPWDTLAYFATKVGTDIAGSVPLIGDFIGKFLRGGEEVSGATLTRFYGFHVAILPMAATFVLTLHLFLIQKQGMSIPIGYEHKVRGRRKFFPDFLLHDMLVWLVVLCILVLVVTFIPSGLGEKADPFSPAPKGIRPEWYFVWMFQTLKFIPSKVFFIEGEIAGVVGSGLFFTLLLFIPFLDRKGAREQKGKLIPAMGILAILFIIVMSVLGYVYAR